jgi:mRNA interferase MazF
MVVVIPLTSNLQALRFPFTVEIKKSKVNGLEKDSIALVFQIQSLDNKRFINKIGVLESSYVSKIDEALKNLIQL